MSLASQNIDPDEFDFVIKRPNGGRVGCVEMASTRVIRIYDRSQDLPVPDGALLLDDVLDELEAMPEVSAHLSSARQQFAADLAESGEVLTIRMLRLRAGHSQQELADVLATSQAAVSEYETRLRKPSEETIRKMARAFSVDFNTLMDALANG